MPRLLLLITDLEFGGTPTVVRELAIRLHGRGHDLAVACLGRRGPVADQIADAGIEVTALGALGAWDWRVLPRLLSLLRHGEFDTVLSFLIHANALASIACSIAGVRLFQSIQTTQPWPRWHWALQRIVAPTAERVIVPSRSVAEAARSRSSIAPERIEVIPNAVDVSRFHLRPRTPARPGRVGFLGRLDPVKHVGDLIDAAALLGDQIRLEIHGEGPERPRLERKIARLGLEHRATLHGATPRPEDALDGLDVLALPSEAEGFGLVLIEAMAAGVAVVATDVPGIRDVVRHERTGLLVPFASPASLASAISRLLEDALLRLRLIAEARREVERRFNWPLVLEQYERLLFPP